MLWHEACGNWCNHGLMLLSYWTCVDLWVIYMEWNNSGSLAKLYIWCQCWRNQPEVNVHDHRKIVTSSLIARISSFTLNKWMYQSLNIDFCIVHINWVMLRQPLIPFTIYHSIFPILRVYLSQIKSNFQTRIVVY
jgi:hypothetical protein